MLNSFLKKLGKKKTSASSWSKARKKLNYTAFIELNEKAIVETVYENEHHRFGKFRLVAVDGTTVILPNEKSIYAEFGVLETANQDPNYKGEYTCSKASVLYDVINHIGINATMGKCNASERDQLLNHLQYLDKNDLLVLDRGYPSYFLFAFLIKNSHEFVMRCSKNAFGAVQRLVASRETDIIVTLKPSSKSEIRKLGLPEEIKVRFVKVQKSDSRVYILATSLLDQQLYARDFFSEIYDLRWEIETFFDIIKNRLSLENFTGKTVESVYQDFFSTFLITGLESVFTDDAQKVLDKKIYNKQPQVVNKSTSFSAIKDHVLELFYSDKSDDLIFAELTEYFLTNPRSLQKGRYVPRKKNTPTKQVLKFYKYKKKYCY